MNYYIQGNKEKADQIKAAFEAKGCVMHTGTQCDLSDMVYFSLNGKVGSLKLRNLDLFKTHPDYQELELPIEPCFKVGDKIKTGSTIETIAEVGRATRSYYCESGRTIWFENQDLWHLAPKSHFDIANFHAGMPVLVREGICCEWRYTIFSHYRKNGTPFCASGIIWHQCIPFEGNEHLLGTTRMPSEEYINW